MTRDHPYKNNHAEHLVIVSDFGWELQFESQLQNNWDTGHIKFPRVGEVSKNTFRYF